MACRSYFATKTCTAVENVIQPAFEDVSHLTINGKEDASITRRDYRFYHMQGKITEC